MDVTCLLAPNPGVMTGPGTNTYVLASGGECVVIDPGPGAPSHRVAIDGAICEARLAAVLLTHHHPDHATTRLSEPARQLRDAETLVVGDVTIEGIHTPGHTGDHVAYLAGDVLFSGDLILGATTVIVESMADYFTSLERVRSIDPARIYPGHGPVVENPRQWIEHYITHRRMRETQILTAVAGRPMSVHELVERMYADVGRHLWSAAAVNVRSHLEKLIDEGRVRAVEGGRYVALQ